MSLRMIEGTTSAENRSNMSLTRKFEGCVESMFKVMGKKELGA